MSSSFRRQACQSVRVCHGCGDPFSGLSGLNFELHLFAKFPDFTTKRGAGSDPGFGTLELVIILGLLIVVTAGNPQRQVRRRSEKKNGRKKTEKKLEE